MDPLLFSILVVWAFTRYGVTDLISTVRGTESPRQRERAQRATQRHERQMARLAGGHSGPTIGDAIAARIAARVDHPKEPRARGPAGQFFTDWWADSWNDAAQRRSDYHQRAKAGELPRQRAWQATKDRVRQRFMPTSAPDPEPVYASAERMDHPPPAPADTVDAELVDPPAEDPFRGYRDGDCVRDTRDGSTGTIRITPLSPEDAIEVGYDHIAEVCWDGSFVQDELDVALPWLEQLGPSDPEPADDDPSPRPPDPQPAPLATVTPTTEGDTTMTTPAPSLTSGETVDPHAALTFAQGIGNVAQQILVELETSIGNLTEHGVSGAPIDHLNTMQEAATTLITDSEAAAGYFSNHIAIQDVAQSDETLGGGRYVGIGA